MSRRIRSVVITLIAVLALGGGAVWFSMHFASVLPGFKTDCPAAAPAGVTEVKRVLGADVSDADRAVIQSGFTGRRKEIRGKAAVAKLTARFAGTDPQVQSVSGPTVGYTLMVTFYRSGTELGRFSFGDTGIVCQTADATAVYSVAKKLDASAIAKTYGLGNP